MIKSSSQAVLLKRDNHGQRTREIFKHIKSDRMFTDVTLASEDGNTITAHKVILAYSSPYLYSILQTEKKILDSPVTLPVKYVHLQSLVEYIYLGETRVEVLMVKEFLGVAKKLQISGLWSHMNDSPNKILETSPQIVKPPVTQEISETAIPSVNQSLKTDIEISKKGSKPGTKYSCHQCDFKATLKRDLKNHNELKHVKEVEKIQCDECGYICSKGALYQHNLLHKGVKLFCDKCNYTTFKSCHLKDHVKNVHEPEYSFCDQCVYQTKRASKLKLHKEQEHDGKLLTCNLCEYTAKIVDRIDDHKKGIHEGNSYQCDQCEYISIFRGPMRQHKHVVHDKVRYACNVCDYQATRSSNLRAHERSVHMN